MPPLTLYVLVGCAFALMVTTFVVQGKLPGHRPARCVLQPVRRFDSTLLTLVRDALAAGPPRLLLKDLSAQGRLVGRRPHTATHAAAR